MLVLQAGNRAGHRQDVCEERRHRFLLLFLKMREESDKAAKKGEKSEVGEEGGEELSAGERWLGNRDMAR